MDLAGIIKLTSGLIKGIDSMAAGADPVDQEHIKRIIVKAADLDLDIRLLNKIKSDRDSKNYSFKWEI